MRTFLSLPWKILALILGALLFMTVILTSFALVKMEQDFRLQQEKQRQLRQQQFEHLNLLLESQLRSWLESFTDLVQIREQPDFVQFAGELARHFETIALHLNVEQLWLFDQKGAVLYTSGSHIPVRVRQAVNQVLLELQPYSEITCTDHCSKLVLVPVQNQAGDIAVVALSTTLLDVLSSLKQGVGSDVAIVRIDGDLQRPAKELRLLSLSNASRMSSVFSALPAEATVSQAIESGLPIEIDDQHYLISFLPLLSNGQSYYLALIDDTNKFANTKAAYKLQMVGFAIFCFGLLAIVIYFSTLRLSRRLLTMAEHLPLLAQKKFVEFRERSQTKPLFFRDELDVLGSAANQLSTELEQLHQKIEQNTRELENIAMYDLLTGLPNRNMLQYQLKKSLAALERNHGQVAVLFLDLDDFKKINDSLGHAYGDKLLVEAARRLRACLRQTDMACRFGGDEFVVVLTDTTAGNYPKEVAQKILNIFKAPIELSGRQFYISTSIGLTTTITADSTTDELIRQADMAMYDAKEQGGADVHSYDLQMFQRLSKRLQLESEIEEAILRKQFNLVLQPQVDLASGKLCGFEALLRWQHPQRGIVSPDDFIDMLENSSQMVELGYWVFRRSFELAKLIMLQGFPNIRIAINLSASQFLDPNLGCVLRELLAEFQLNARHFELELTERTLVKDFDVTLQCMNELKEMGFIFAIDDFGTGYSSLSYLKQMPVDIIKIDKSFVFGMLENHADFQIITSTIAMVHALDLTVVAEGVENRAQYQVLKEQHCDIAQGYFFAKPMTEEQLISFLRNYPMSLVV
jgi:diguanylate cyclase (GGDEF)-like protein